MRNVKLRAERPLPVTPHLREALVMKVLVPAVVTVVAVMNCTVNINPAPAVREKLPSCCFTQGDEPCRVGRYSCETQARLREGKAADR